MITKVYYSFKKKKICPDAFGILWSLQNTLVKTVFQNIVVFLVSKIDLEVWSLKNFKSLANHCTWHCYVCGFLSTTIKRFLLRLLFPCENRSPASQTCHQHVLQHHESVRKFGSKFGLQTQTKLQTFTSLYEYYWNNNFEFSNF